MRLHELLENTKAVKALEKMLKEPHSYQAIDAMMKQVSEKYGITPEQLHDYFKDQNGEIPDNWAKKHLREEEDEPRVRKVEVIRPDGSKSVTYEVVNARGITVKTEMSKWDARKYLETHWAELS